MVVLPVPGDIRGLAAGTQFQTDAVTAGEAIIVTRGGSEGIGLVPDFVYDDDDDPDYDPEPRALSWTVYSLAHTPVEQHLDLGQAEYDLRAAVRSAADALGALRAGANGADVADPRGMVEQILEATRLHRAPDHAPERAHAGAGERRARRRDHHGECRADADRVAVLLGAPDGQRGVATADGRGAFGATGGRQRDPALGVAGLIPEPLRTCGSDTTPQQWGEQGAPFTLNP